MGPDVISCDFFAKLIFCSMQLVRVFFARKSWSSNFQDTEPKLSPHFQKLAIKPIERLRFKQQNIDLIIFKYSIVIFKRANGAASNFNAFYCDTNALKPVLGSYFHIRAQNFTIYRACLIVLFTYFFRVLKVLMRVSMGYL